MTAKKAEDGRLVYENGHFSSTEYDNGENWVTDEDWAVKRGLVGSETPGKKRTCRHPASDVALCHRAKGGLSGKGEQKRGGESGPWVFKPVPEGLSPSKEKHEIEESVQPETRHEEGVARGAEGVGDGENERIENGSRARADGRPGRKGERVAFHDAPRGLAVEERVGLRHGHVAVCRCEHSGKIISGNLKEPDAEHERGEGSS